MAIEILRNISEPVYAPESGQEAVFSVDRLPPGKMNFYLVSFYRPVTEDELGKVVKLAEEETRRAMDDDGMTHTDHFETDTLECKFTHALEHVAISGLTRMNPLAGIRIRNGAMPGGYTHHGVLKDDPTHHVYYFEVNSQIAPRPDLEIASIKMTCGKVQALLS